MEKRVGEAGGEAAAAGRPLRLAVVGSRTFADRERLFRLLDRLRPRLECVVTGGARGADALAEEWARERGVPVVVLRADWRRFGRGAGPRRNAEVVAAATAVLAFWDGASRGTADTVRRARAAGVPVHVVRFDRPEPA